ncbi:hypothetical protein Tco_0208062, partial [Tanacetum coccineum]
VSGRTSELKTTIDAGLLHRGNLLQIIGGKYERWNLLVEPVIDLGGVLDSLFFSADAYMHVPMFILRTAHPTSN